MFDTLFNEKLNEEIDENNSQVTEQEKIEVTFNGDEKTEPLTLKQAREKVEFSIIQEYFKDSSKEEVVNYIATHPNLSEQMVHNLSEAFKL
ncbi:MAG: hypothetical protein AB7S44_00545 [Spirochaetales bacterium]